MFSCKGINNDDLYNLLGIYVKAPLIKSLELKIQNVHQRRSSLLIDRRRQDMRDESNESMNVKGEEEEQRRRSVECEGRRRRKRERREREGVQEHDEGMSSDDELLESDKIKFASELGNNNLM